ncbi:putative leader peptide [Streptomyces griseofuscus]|uniref:putative leader peptide n=1 Tax=Streptomyces griseofuscus TaxID=146922 RepID=UPI0034E084ED
MGARAVRGVEVQLGSLTSVGPRRVAVAVARCRCPKGADPGARTGRALGACTAPEPHALRSPRPLAPLSLPLTPPRAVTLRPHRDRLLTAFSPACCTPVVTDTCVRLWRRVHMDLVRYAGCVCRPSC